MFDTIQSAQNETCKKEARRIQLQLYPHILSEFGVFHTANNRLLELIYEAILNDRPLEFVGFWGVGGKNRLDQNDLTLIQYYEMMDLKIKESHPKGMNITILLADVHGLFNGYEPHPYIHLVQEELSDRDIQSFSLQQLYAEWELNLPDINEPINYSSSICDNFFSPRAKCKHAGSIIKENAKKYNKRVLDSELAAYHY